MTQQVTEEIERAERTLEIIHRVHAELEDGKPWQTIDNGLRGTLGQNFGYESWLAYMDARCRDLLESIVVTYRLPTDGQS